MLQFQKKIRPSCRKIFRPHFVFVWFRKSNKNLEIQAYFLTAFKMFWQRVAEREKAMYEFSPTVLRRSCASSGFLYKVE